MSFVHGFITEEEFGVIYEAYQTKNLIFPHRDYDRFSLDNLEESEIYAEFRVRKRDIERLADALGLPESFICHQRTRADKLEGLCMVLKRLAYKWRINQYYLKTDIVPLFNSFLQDGHQHLEIVLLLIGHHLLHLQELLLLLLHGFLVQL